MHKFQPDGWPTVTPRIFVRDPEKLVAFIKYVFHARGELYPSRPAEIRIGDSVVMVSDGGGLRESVQAFLYVYVEDTDSTYKRAIAANAVSIEEPADMPYGDRRAMVKDEWGNTWQIATHKHHPSAVPSRSGWAASHSSEHPDDSGHEAIAVMDMPWPWEAAKAAWRGSPSSYITASIDFPFIACRRRLPVGSLPCAPRCTGR